MVLDRQKKVWLTIQVSTGDEKCYLKVEAPYIVDTESIALVDVSDPEPMEQDCYVERL
jgi:hypothetical protein